MRGAIPPPPNTPSWPGAQLKYRDNLTLPFLPHSNNIILVMSLSSTMLACRRRLNAFRFNERLSLLCKYF
jgi:hypothetical protein